MSKLNKIFLPLALFSITASANITGAGSTFVYPLMSKWAADYQGKTGVQVNYQAIGSGGGISQISAKTVDFAETDKPLSPSELEAGHLKQFPLIMGAIVMAQHVSVNGTLVLDGPTLADIYMGKVKYWDDAAIKKLNPTLKLPHQAVTVIYRADGSGTTYNFTHYLSQLSPQFKSGVGSNTAVSWPAGIGGKGNAGVANFVKTVPGSIGYVEYAYANSNNLPMVSMKNAAGMVVAPTPKSFDDAAAGVRLMAGGVLNWGQGNRDAWPMMAATYTLMRTDVTMNHAEVYDFFKFALAESSVAAGLAYVPLSSTMVSAIQQSWPKK